MTHDVVLRLKPALFGLPKVEIEKPPDLTVPTGRLDKPPPAWSTAARYFGGEPNVAAIRNWLHTSLSDPLLRAISGFVGGRPTRLFITSTKEMPELLTTPWEILEESQGNMQVGEQLSVIRSFGAEIVETPLEEIPVTLRLLVTCANPDGDIPKYEEHLDDLRAIEKTSDGAVKVMVAPFTDSAAVQVAGAEFQPNVVYHFGHAEQPTPGGKVSLRVGPDKQRTYVNGADYAQLIRGISPNLLVLNACAAVSGHEMNPYLGIAREALAAAPSVVCMQTKVPSGAAQRFIHALFGDLVNAIPLSWAMRRARLAMIQGRVIGTGGIPLFTRFIPVQLARGSTDPRFTLAESGLSKLRLSNRLKSYLDTTMRLLPRTLDPTIDDLLRNGSGAAIITGPKECGKSTTVCGRLRGLVESASGTRYLYYRVRKDLADAKSGLRQILNDLTDDGQFGWLTSRLRLRIAEKQTPDAHREIAELETWLAEEADAGRRYVIVLDDLPPDLAAAIGQIAVNVIEHGLLVLVTAKSSLDLTHIDLSYMSEGEIATASGDAQNAKAILQQTGGVPYLVRATLDRKPVDPANLDSFLETLSQPAQLAVRLAALAHAPLPRGWIDAFEAGIPILNETADGVSIVEAVRDAVGENDAPRLRAELHELFASAGEQPARGAVERARALRWKDEAVYQALELVKLYRPQSEEESETWLQNALTLCLELHRTYIVEAGDAVAAKALWERYLAVSLHSDREADTGYGEAVAETGDLEHADRILEGVTGTDARDDVQVSALLLRSDVVKRLGKAGSFDVRLELLNEALEVVLELIDREPQEQFFIALRGEVELSLGNLLAYGRQTQFDEAERHLRESFSIFNALNDPRAYRASAEIIEMRRYNRLMSDVECTEAIETIGRQLDELSVRSMPEDAVRHLYELGRLERDLRRRAKWFRQAFEAAGDSFAPLNWHAALQWKLAELEAGDEVETDVIAWAEKLARWPEDVQSQRLRRRALQVVAGRAMQRSENGKAADLLRDAWQIVETRYKYGEGRRDRRNRLAIARAIDQLMRSGTAVSVASEQLLRDSLHEEATP